MKLYNRKRRKKMETKKNGQIELKILVYNYGEKK
jgi:hypothetical protein